MNSVNPFRLEGQKSIMYRILEARDWKPPTGSSSPAETSATAPPSARRSMELHELGLIKKIPRLAVINAAGANTLYNVCQQARPAMGTTAISTRPPSRSIYAAHGRSRIITPHTVASAIEIGRPVNLPKALRALDS